MTATVVTPRIRGFLCTNAHPEGCAVNVRRQVAAARQAGPGSGLGPVLVLGSSTGYGLSSAITAVWGWGARCLGVCYERPPSDRTASAGWYNLAEVHRLAREQGRRVETINGDAFSHEVKERTVEALVRRFGPLDLVIYSLAPRRAARTPTPTRSGPA
jgi:enoyl-[acyl-carrier protein] reductase/trans-2-enoyl-CoA reductase (NAD+)